uniref:Protein kinase domain-containing protein n=1 Tax=Spongospora subterranea TaxID=70186 RepID=A0A0H5RA66_9EUKA|eukprot:CRZ05299.1 hypothetical protein [Spongospora subterranea]
MLSFRLRMPGIHNCSEQLADFGVSVQLTSTVSKRKTVIGTPYWMAPEVLKETNYDAKADIWSLGITAFEMAIGTPPHANIHPMRVIFIIPTKPPPTLPDPSQWSVQFNDFLLRCLVKDADRRPTAVELLQHPFIVNAPGRTLLQELAMSQQSQIDDFRENQQHQQPAPSGSSNTVITDTMSTMLNTASGTMVFHDNMSTVVVKNTMFPDHFQNSLVEKDDFETMSTMVIRRPADNQLDLEEDSNITESSSLSELTKALEALNQAHIKERDALESFYESRRVALVARIRKAEINAKP